MNDSPPIPDNHHDSDAHLWDEAAAAESPDERDGIRELREDLAAAAAEWRRGTRRSMEVMKEFGGALTAIGGMMRDLHEAARQPAAALPAAAGHGLNEDWLATLIDLSDRLARIAAAFDKAPMPSAAWWPGARAALAAWRTAWATQREAFAILQDYMESVLARAGLERLNCAGAAFDPAIMTAVEVVADASVSDHTVIAEFLSGWRRTASQKIVRPAQVRVSRRP